MLIGIRPKDSAYENATGGVTYHEQTDTQTLAFYEITGTDAEIQFNISSRIEQMVQPVLFLYSHWGSTDFSVVDRLTDKTLVDEQSGGVSTNVWPVNLTETSGIYSLTNFKTNQGVDGTVAGWPAFVGVQEADPEDEQDEILFGQFA